MAKGSKRAKIKQALSPVRNIVSPESSKSPPSGSNEISAVNPPIEPGEDEGDNLLDELMAELDSRDETVKVEAATVLREVQNNNKAEEQRGVQKKDGKSRHRARQERKAAELADKYAPVDAEADARLQHEAEEEKRLITEVCDKLNLEMHEINPDGHCLFSAIADQLTLLGLLPEGTSYAAIRAAAASHLRAHTSDFLPFLPSTAGEDGAGAAEDGLMSPAQYERYCAAIERTAQWGGEPEIQALARVNGVPIHVVQGAQPRVVVHEPGTEAGGGRPAIISYHRRMYGLGEHYNSLRPKQAA